MDIMELKELRKKLHRTLNGPALPVSVVIDAVDILVREMQSGVYVDLLGDYDVGAYPERLSLTTKQLGSRTLRKRLEDELPPHDPSFSEILFWSEGEPATNEPSRVPPIEVELVREE